MTQAALAREADMTQNNVSRLESPDYGKHTISSLKRIAEALDVALVVRFVPFSQYIDWLSGTPHLDTGLTPEALAVPSFTDEERARVFDTQIRYIGIRTSSLNQQMRVPTNPFSQEIETSAYLQVPPAPVKLEFERAVSNG
jgi:transcriptional regulator with XRE-family HTH domain